MNWPGVKLLNNQNDESFQECIQANEKICWSRIPIYIFSSVYDSKRGTFEFCWASLNSNIEGFLAVGIVRVINNNKKEIIHT